MKIDISNKLAAVILAFPIIWTVAQVIAWGWGIE
jgi:hypothetical protein